jgi:hypothetical protein
MNLEISLFGDLSDEGTPGPIPNPEVKLVSADGTWWVTAWESRSLPTRLFHFHPFPGNFLWGIIDKLIDQPM